MKNHSVKELPLADGRFLRRTTRLAEYYGFTSADLFCNAPETPRATTKPLGIELRSGLGSSVASALAEHLTNDAREPALWYHLATSNKALSFGLDIVGMSQSIADALIVKVALAILEEAGFTDTCVHINSIGDRESIVRFRRELQNFLRKNIEDIPPQGVELMKRDILDTFVFLNKKAPALFEMAPKPMEFLSESGRRHFREMLQHLETANVAYEVDNDLVSCGDFYTQTLFEIRAKQEPSEFDDELRVRRTSVLARGGRYDEFLRTTNYTPANGVRILLYAEKCDAVILPAHAKTKRRPKVYFIPLGANARLRALPIIDMLRKEQVPLYQTIGIETLSGQLMSAEKLAIPYAIIMGQKEVMDHTVIVRNLSSRRQDTISVDALSSYLKHMGL